MFIVINQERGERREKKKRERGCEEGRIFLKISMKCLGGYKHTEPRAERNGRK